MYRFQRLDHFHAVPLQTTMRLAKQPKRLRRPRLRFAHAQRHKARAKRLVRLQHIKVGLQHALGMLHQSAVHGLGALQLLQPLHQRVVAQYGARQAQRVGRARRHALDEAVFDLFQRNVQRLALRRLSVQFVVVDYHLVSGGLYHFRHGHLGFALYRGAVDCDQFVAALQGALAGCRSAVKDLSMEVTQCRNAGIYIQIHTCTMYKHGQYGAPPPILIPISWVWSFLMTTEPEDTVIPLKGNVY